MSFNFWPSIFYYYIIIFLFFLLGLFFFLYLFFFFWNIQSLSRMQYCILGDHNTVFLSLVLYFRISVMEELMLLMEHHGEIYLILQKSAVFINI